MTIFDDWRDGTISDVEALHALASDLGEIESQLAPLEAERQNLRDQLSQIVNRLGGRTSVPGFGKLEIMPASVTRSYDKKRLDQLVIRSPHGGLVEAVPELRAFQRMGHGHGLGAARLVVGVIATVLIFLKPANEYFREVKARKLPRA